MSPESELPPSGRRGLLLFAATTFASAFLIFLVQPMVGKRILPWFGGVPAVWTLCLAFYQVTLFAGYAYAHCVIRYVPPVFQLPLHGLLLAGALLALPVLPSEAWTPAGGAEPSRAILTILSFKVALPFLALAATGPLVQAWFAGRYPERSPYPLYAVSNAGSLLAMLSYPFVLEPHLPLSTTGRLWSFAFAATGFAVLACARLARRGAAGALHTVELETGEPSQPPRLGSARVALWFLLSACTVVLLMGVTNELCLDVASVPFLWILPLSIYLISFILCFGDDRPNRRVPYLVLAAGPFILPTVVDLLGLGESGIVEVVGSVKGQIVFLCVMLFGACMLLHGELHRLRPPPRSLTTFYLCISGGGAFGGVFVGLIAPHIFDDYTEFRLGLTLGCVLLLIARWHDSQGWLNRAAPRWRWAVAAVVAVLLVSRFGWGGARPDELVYLERTFFGVLRIQQFGDGVNEQRQLLSGTTLHGVQFPGSERRPTSYYGELTGIGLALTQRDSNQPSAIGVVGLGIGTLAAYGRPGDHFRFYEINPAVIRVARDPRYFSYLANSAAELEIVEGDARVSLASELKQDGPRRFDFLIVDAFSSDAIPVHLMTREAFELYEQSVKPEGLLAIHTSNRRLDLTPLVARLGESTGFSVLAIGTDAMGRYLSAQSVWVFLSRDPERIQSLVQFALARKQQLGLREDKIQFKVYSPAEIAETPLWTDDYSDLFGAMEPLSVSLEAAPAG